MMTPNKSARYSEAKAFAPTLEKSLKSTSGRLSVADAAEKSGLSLRESEQGLHFLVSEYRGHLSATDKGELLFEFPYGFAKPWETVDKMTAVWGKAKSVGLGILKFVVRAWITVVMVGYVAIFAAILIALTLANRNDRDSGPSFGGTMLFHTLFRVVMDSLFWTFHPFSPFYVGRGHRDYRRMRRQEKGMPFYEKVNRFFFGPEKEPEDPLLNKKRVLQEIRAKHGRIGLADVMRVTGLERDQADPLLAKLMFEFDGEVLVSEEGGVTYTFSDLRKSAQLGTQHPVDPIWNTLETLPPLTGNPTRSNLLVGGLNGFNFVMSSVAIANSWTIEKLQWMLTYTPSDVRLGLAPPMPEGIPWVLGYIPFYFSAALCLIPLTRLLNRPKQIQKVAQKNGRLGLLKTILTRLRRGGLKEEELKEGYAQLAKKKPGERELIREVVKLGGELEINEHGETTYHFRDLESEASALESERRSASKKEQEVGNVVFSSAN